MSVSTPSQDRQTHTGASTLASCDLGDLRLESGEVIADLHMSYVTYGTLNADASNVVLALHGLVADHTQLDSWIGPDLAIDPERWFIVAPDTLGVTTDDPQASTSPTRSGLNMRFPRYTMRDMVAADHRLLTVGLGLGHVAAVIGVSFGAIAALQWAVSYPNFMDAVVAVTPEAQAYRQGALLWESARRAIMLDPKWQDGDYPADDPPAAGAVLGLLIQSMFGSSSGGFQSRFSDSEAVRDYYVDQSEELGGHTFARDWVYRTWAADSVDIAGAFEGDLGAAARAIRARTLLIVNRYDQLLPPAEGRVIEAAHHIADTKIVDFDDIEGHYAHRNPRGLALVTTEVSDLLNRVADGRPGFTGPKWPRHWTRDDVNPDA